MDGLRGDTVTSWPFRRATSAGADRVPERARLTEKNSKVFEKMGRSRKSDKEKSTGHLSSTSTTTDKNPNCSKPPANLKYRQDRLDRARELDYQYFAAAIWRAPNEASVAFETSTLLKRYNEPGYHKSYNQPFSNFPFVVA